ncbi:MAG: SHS2 domain-containing protein [Candidatus Nanohaloarchaea archaeon]|jgi:SHS2 domain-containing protein
MSYEILEHSADEKFHAQGETLEEAFKEAVKAFSEIVEGGGGMYTHSIEVESENLEALLFDFLDQLIRLQDIEQVVVSHAKNLDYEELNDAHRIEADIMVDTIDLDEKPLDIKAPTYNEMKVDYIKGEGWTLEAVLDI